MPARLTPVDDPADPRVRAYLALKDADLRARAHQKGWSDPEGGVGGRFMAEGERVVERLLESRFPLESMLVQAGKADRLHPLIERVPARAPIFAASQAVMDGIVGFHIHRGVLACAQRGLPLELAEVAGRARVLVVLEGLTNHDNVGAIFRNAAALGADGVLLSTDCCDPLYRKAIRVSMGHVLRVPFAGLEPWAEGLEGLRRMGFALIALAPGEGSEAIGGAPPGRIALLVGTEGAGLRPETLALCDRRIKVPMRPGVDSLNVAVAMAIALHRLAM